MSTPPPLPPASDFWVHTLDPFLIQFPDSWPMDGIRWYGTAYIAGFLVAMYLLSLYFQKGRSPLNPAQQSSLMTALFIGVLAGGRVGYMVLYSPGELLANPFSVFAVWQGGMASHGGFIGVCLAILWFAHRHTIDRWRLADIVVTLAPAGLLFGRLANFINAELWGKVTDIGWAVIFPIKQGDNVIGWTLPRHPSQLYEAFLEGLVLLIYVQIRFWKSDPAKRPTGQLAGEFLAFYGIVRIFGEQFREPDEGVSLILGLSRGVFYSIFVVIIGCALIWWRRQGASLWQARMAGEQIGNSTPEPENIPASDDPQAEESGLLGSERKRRQKRFKK